MKLRNKKDHPLAFVVDGVKHEAAAMGPVVPDVDPRKVECVLLRGLPIEHHVEPEAKPAAPNFMAPAREPEPEAKPAAAAPEPQRDNRQDNRGGQGRR